MRRLQFATLVSLTAFASAGCTDVTEEETQEAYDNLESHEVSSDTVTGDSIDGNGNVRLTVAVEDCEVEIVDNGYELTIDRVNGKSVGYPIDLEPDAQDQIDDVCRNPDGYTWNFWD